MSSKFKSLKSQTKTVSSCPSVSSNSSKSSKRSSSSSSSNSTQNNSTNNNNTKSSNPTRRGTTPSKNSKLTSTNNRTSPFKSFITTGPRIRHRYTQCNDFAYDLSKDELHFMATYPRAMKSVPDREKELLKLGQREAYLALRYEHSPDRKYNYPEATSWRIGWLHNQQTKQSLSGILC